MNRSRRVAFAAAILLTSVESAQAQAPAWAGYGQNAQHTGISTVAAGSMDRIGWSTVVDLNPNYSGGNLLTHYGSPMITGANTVIVGVKTGTTDGFKINAYNGATGSLLWTQSTDYSRPPASWVPPYSSTLSPTNRLYYATAGGTISYRDGVDGASASGSGQIAFFGNSNYNASPSTFNQNVFVNTPITSDSQGNIYFGYQVTGSVTVNGSALTSGIARIDANGAATYIPISTYDSTMSKLTTNNAPALSNDGQTLYFTVNNGSFGSGQLVAVNASNLSLVNKTTLFDPRGAGTSAAILPDSGTASVTVAPDGRVLVGVLESPFTNSHGWLLQYNAGLTTKFTPGAFGWDDTASIVPKSMVDAMRSAGKYSGTSDYLVFTKYNDYGGFAGGTGHNRIAILDPNDTQVINGVTVMKEVESILGVTPDPEFPGLPGAVREWCINAAAIDPYNNCIFANSEDGRMYRWDVLTNSFTQIVGLTGGVGEAYTPTVIGADGTIYAINNGVLFALTPIPEPGTIALVGCFALAAAMRRRRAG